MNAFHACGPVLPLVSLTLLHGFCVQAGTPVMMARAVAIDQVCAWPNLMTLADGTVIATIFGQPSHGRAEGDVECWASQDGLSWSKRGVAAPHEPSANRMNVAAGLAGNGDLLVISSGWSLDQDASGAVKGLREVLAPWVCRSGDQGRTWRVDKVSFPRALEGRTHFIPFGDILPGADGALRVAGYARDQKTKRDQVWLFRSPDDGRTWAMQSLLGDANNETAIFHVGEGRWLAAARSLREAQHRLDLYRSQDDGQTWAAGGPLTGDWQHPGHLTRLPDGRLLLTYGNRIKGQHGVQAKLSADGGVTWGEPWVLVDDLVSGDCGYPASVARRDGSILTAYYSNGSPDHRHYHMGVVIWKTPSL